MRESDQRLSEMILGRDNHNYMARSPFHHDYEDADRDHFGRTADNYLQGNSQEGDKQFHRGDRVQVGGPLGGYGTVETVYTRDAKVRVRMDQTFRLMVLPSERVEVIEKKEREK